MQQMASDIHLADEEALEWDPEWRGRELGNEGS